MLSWNNGVIGRRYFSWNYVCKGKLNVCLRSCQCMDGVGLPEGMTELVEKATGSSEQPVCRVETSRLESGVA